jgi:hypothetical protein
MAKPVKQIPGNCRIGDGTPGPGRPKGSANKATTAVREAIARFAENNVEQLQGWLEKSAEKNPDKAADLFLRALEYHIPKLARTETILDGEMTLATRLVIKRPTDG